MTIIAAACCSGAMRSTMSHTAGTMTVDDNATEKPAKTIDIRNGVAVRATNSTQSRAGCNPDEKGHSPKDHPIASSYRNTDSGVPRATHRSQTHDQHRRKRLGFPLRDVIHRHGFVAPQRTLTQHVGDQIVTDLERRLGDFGTFVPKHYVPQLMCQSSLDIGKPGGQDDDIVNRRRLGADRTLRWRAGFPDRSRSGAHARGRLSAPPSAVTLPPTTLLRRIRHPPRPERGDVNVCPARLTHLPVIRVPGIRHARQPIVPSAAMLRGKSVLPHRPLPLPFRLHRRRRRRR